MKPLSKVGTGTLLALSGFLAQGVAPVGARQGRLAPWRTGLEIDLHGAAGPLSAENGGHESAADYDAVAMVAHVVVPSAPVARDFLFRPR